jgi:hemolysin III
MRHLSQEEYWNTATHGIAACFVALVSPALIATSMQRNAALESFGIVVFCVTLLTLFIASTLYHQESRPLIKARLKVFDHCAIFLLIAGSYTPFSLVALRDNGGHWLLLTVWSLALAGVVFKLFFAGRFRVVSTLIYLAMGWLVMLVIKPLFANISDACACWLIFGGVGYTVGALFYLARNLAFSHVIWHVFVILGAFGHFIAIALQALSPAKT